MQQQQQQRIFLWAVPRSISTAFFRAMMNKTNCKVILEPFSKAFYFGNERKSKRYLNDPPQDGCTFEDMKKLCEQDYPEAKTVFVKDMAYHLTGLLDTPKYLPNKYIHTFILRDPSKSVYSLYKMSLDRNLTGWDHFNAEEAGFKELFSLYKLVTEQLGQEAIVVDADDLLKHPETIFRAYCSKVGIEFEESMLNWEEKPQDLSVFQEWMPWFEGVLTSKSFQPSATKQKSPMIAPDLPRHVQKAIDENMAYYEKMYAQRIKPNFMSVN